MFYFVVADASVLRELLQALHLTHVSQWKHRPVVVVRQEKPIAAEVGVVRWDPMRTPQVLKELDELISYSTFLFVGHGLRVAYGHEVKVDNTHVKVDGGFGRAMAKLSVFPPPCCFRDERLLDFFSVCKRLFVSCEGALVYSQPKELEEFLYDIFLQLPVRTKPFAHTTLKTLESNTKVVMKALFPN